MGWQDAPAVNNPPAASTAKAGWASAPAVDAAPPEPPLSDEEFGNGIRQILRDHGNVEADARAVLQAFVDKHRPGHTIDAKATLAAMRHGALPTNEVDYRSADQRPTSFWQGVGEGIEKPFNNAARALEWGAPVVAAGMSGVPGGEGQIRASMRDVSRALGMAGTVDEAANAQQEAHAASPTQGSGAGRFVGELAGTLPAAYVPGGILAQGAAGGALLTDAHDPIGVAVDAGVGAVGSKIGAAVINRIGSVIAPHISGPLKTLIDAGVRVTPGQAARAASLGGGPIARTAAGALAAVEDKATSLPVVGDIITANRARGSEQFVRGAIGKVMSALGRELPEDVPTGHAAVLHAKQALKEAYTSALGQMVMVPDHQLLTEVNNLGQKLADGALDEPHTKRFEQVVRNIVQRRMGAKGMTGENLKATISELGNKAAKFKGSVIGAEREYGDALMDLAGMLKSAAVRSSPPEAVAELRAADTAYAHYVRVRGAARNATGGVFTPGQLEVAVRAADTSVGKGDTATGQALMQDYATAGRQVLPSHIADSGTAGRKANFNPVAWGLGAAMSLPYGLAKLGTAALTRTPGPTASQFGRALKLTAPKLGIAAPAAIAQSRQ
jgi:hypothetical protein